MSWHASEEDLVLHTYGGLARGERERIERHLAACAGCRALRDDIVAAMQVFDAVTVPEPGPGFERALWARVASACPPQEAYLPMARMRWRLASVWIAGLAAAVAMLVLSIAVPGSQRQRADGRVAQGGGVQERVLLTALDDHFARTELLLVELRNTPGSASDLAFERAMADDLVASGRLHRDTALQSGETQVTAVLDDLEAVLVEVARGPDRFGASDLDLLRTQIDEYGLLFKVRAVGDRIRARREATVLVRHQE